MKDDQLSVSHPIVKGLAAIYLLILAFTIYSVTVPFLNSDLKSAKITECTGSWSKVRTSSNSTTYRDVVSYAPVARSDDGAVARGSFMVPSRSFCAQQVGKSVQILVHSTDQDLNKIHNFSQYWLLPSIVFFFGASFYIGLRSPWAVRLFFLIYVLGSGYAFSKDYGLIERYLPQFAGVDIPPSEAALNRCVWASMAERKIEKREELDYLICLDENITDLSSIQDLRNLERLFLQGNDIRSVKELSAFYKLKELSLANNKNLQSLEGIENLTQLEKLYVNKGALDSLKGLERAQNLRILQLMSNQITDISPLTNLENLEQVILSYNNISDLSALANKPRLKELQIYNNHITDITPLNNNQAMQIVGVSGKASIPCNQLRTLRQVLGPKAKIYGPKSCGTI